jgi:hypothetical protein
MSTDVAPHVFTAADPEPDVSPGAIAVVNFGDYRYQEVWVADGSNIGNWYSRGWIDRSMPSPPHHPHWEDVVARGPVTLMQPTAGAMYLQGWRDGRARLVEQIGTLADDER